MYNTTNITEANDFFSIAGAVNSLSGNLFASVGLFVLFIIIFVAAQNEGNRKKLFLADSFVISVVAAVMFFAGWISWHVLMLPIILMFASVMVILFIRD